MDGIRQQLFIDYMYYLNEADRFYATKARYAKHVLGFLESASSVDRRGFMAFKREHSLEMANDYSCGTAICDFLNFCGKGYNRKKKSKVKTLEKLSVVSDKNKEQLNGFMAWLDENFDYSPHTLNMYYFSLKKFFEYANEVNMSNAKMYVSTLEEQALSPQTIRLRILAMGKYGKVTSRGLSSNMKAWGKSCGIPLEKMHPHAFRHFFAKMFLKKNHDIVLLADLLGHANMDTTRIYLQKSYEEQKASFTRSVSW